MSRSWAPGNRITVLNNLAGPPFTVSMWVKTAFISPTLCSSTGLMQIGGTILMGYQSGTGVSVFRFTDSFGNPTLLDMRGTTNVTDANWHNLVFVGANSSTCRIFGNGVQENAINSTGFPSTTRSDLWWPQNGGSGAFTDYTGALAELAVWPGAALNADEIAQLYNGVLPCFIRPDSLNTYIPAYGVDGVGGGEAQYGVNRTAPTVGTSSYSPHPPVSQLDIGFPGTIGFSQLPEQWTGTWAQANFANAPPAGFADWSPPSA